VTAPATSVPVADPIANGSNGAAAYDDTHQNDQTSPHDYDPADQDHDMQPAQSYEYNEQHNDYASAQQQGEEEEDYKPIGIKEDG